MLFKQYSDINNCSRKMVCFDYDRILNKSNVSLYVDPIHITDAIAPMSDGGVHDYYSNGDYWWPNPDKPNGLPFVRRDGVTNPNCFDRHRILLRSLRTNVVNLAAAYTISRDEAYASKSGHYSESSSWMCQRR